jgi:hypothetical protein
MNNEEILTRVKNSLKIVKSKMNEILNVIDNPKIECIEKSLWKIAEELEFSASLISITFGLGDYYPDLKDLKKTTLTKIINDLRDSLDKIEKIIDSDPKESYNIIRSVIHKTRAIQSNLKSYF